MLNQSYMLASAVLLGSALLMGGCASADDQYAGEAGAVGQVAEALTMSSAGMLLSQSGVTDVAVISAASNTLDMFVARNGKVDVWHFASGSWQNLGQLGLTNRTIKNVAAVANGSRQDVMLWAGNQIFWTFSTSLGSFSSAVQLNIPATRSSTNIALTSWAPGRLDLFWATPNGNLGHSWFTNNALTGTETGDTAGTNYLQPLSAFGGNSAASLEAVSWGSGRIDIMFVGGSDGKLHQHWYDRDNGGWGPSNARNRRAFLPYHFSQQERITPDDLALTSKGSGKLDLMVHGTIPGTHSQTTKFYAEFSSGGWFLDNLGRMRLENVVLNGPDGATGVDTAVRWGTTKQRLDIFDGTSSGVWQTFGTVF
ncbi:MAG TPA: hypothetical protein VJV79_34965 [Polyangiaceae bacterium]|nr:hypothetical protein [Polyangiaceae bacterium]